MYPLLDVVFGPGTFEVVVTGSDGAALKPDPAAYRQALARLGVPASRALAVEDSQNGLRAALAAGLVCIVVTNDFARGQDFHRQAAGRSRLAPGIRTALAAAPTAPVRRGTAGAR